MSIAPPSVLEEVDPTVTKHYPILVPAVHACLSVFAAMSLAERTKPLSLIFEGASGFGKTAVLQMVFPSKDSGLEQYAYRSDKFTPKSFVSHAANVKEQGLAKVDMLPKLQNKVLVTKELAPIFRGREQDLQDNFSILISVLDGKGFTSDSGMRGQRGYEGPILFNWVGATTPLPPSTHRLMSQLGTRLLFYDIPTLAPTELELFEYGKKDSANDAETECSAAVRAFLLRLFEAWPIGLVWPEWIKFPESLMHELTRWAQFLVAARAEVACERVGSNWEPVAAMPPEGPWKVVNYFKDLARGHALIECRLEIEQTDLDLVAEVAISSVPGNVRPLIRMLRESDKIDTTMVSTVCKVSAPTARNYLRQLGLLGIAKVTPGRPQTNQPDRATLAKEYKWLCREP